MNINPNKSAYTYINDLQQKQMDISFPTPEGIIKNLKINSINNTDNYKYLGLEINLKLDFSKTISQSQKKYKKIITTICKKKYLGPNLLIKLINTVAIPKINYNMYFINYPKESLESLNIYTKNKLCSTFKIPSITPTHYWHYNYNLNNFQDINTLKYTNNYIDRGLNSSSPLKRNTIILNHIKSPITTFIYNPPINNLLQNLNITIKEQ